jgi:hypothetical protein
MKYIEHKLSDFSLGVTSKIQFLYVFLNFRYRGNDVNGWESHIIAQFIIA